jgi:hypothetical protein
LRWGTERQQKGKNNMCTEMGKHLKTFSRTMTESGSQREDPGRTGKEANDDEKGKSKERN